MFSYPLFFARTLRVFLLAGVTCSLSSLANTLAIEKTPGWQISASFSEESVGQGLPVLALEQDDWPNYLPNPVRDGRASRRLKAQLLATHPSGWRLAAITRAQAWMEASADAIAIVALQKQGRAPSEPRQFQLFASSQSWSGEGLLLGTPWWTIGAAGLWQWQADITLLNLTQLRLADASGTVHYRGSGTYDFELRSQRSNTDITGRFLPASGNVGTGASFSLALQGEPFPSWYISMRVDDLSSVLQWGDLPTDSNTLNSAVTTRTQDAYLVPDRKPHFFKKRAALFLSTNSFFLGICTQLRPGFSFLLQNLEMPPCAGEFYP